MSWKKKGKTWEKIDMTIKFVSMTWKNKGMTKKFPDMTWEKRGMTIKVPGMTIKFPDTLNISLNVLSNPFLMLFCMI